MKILIIDDNTSITTMMQKYFQINKNDCTIVNNGRTGLALILDQKFDVVILDLAMPEFDGFDVLKALKERGKTKSQKIFVLTASNLSKEDMDRLSDLDIHSCLAKPISMQVLQDSLVN